MPDQQALIIKKIVQKIGKDRTAILLGFISAIIFPFTFIYSNEQNITSIENNLARGMGIVIFNTVYGRITCEYYLYKDSSSFILGIYRGLIMCFYVFMLVICQFYVPLPIIFTINSSGALIVFVIDYIVNKTVVTKNQMIGAVVGVLGLILAVNGQLIKKILNHEYEFKTSFKNYHTQDQVVTFLMCLLFMLTLCLWAYGIVLTKRINQSSIQINTTTGILAIIIFSIAYQIFITNPISFKTFVYAIILGGIPLGLISFMFVTSLKLTKYSGRVTMLTFFHVVVGYMISIFRYEEGVNQFSLLGDILLVLGVYKVIFI